MSFQQVSIQEQIKEKTNRDPKFAEAWKDSRNEYELLHEITRIRKEQSLTQKQLAELSGSTQQEISRLGLTSLMALEAAARVISASLQRNWRTSSLMIRGFS